MSQVLFQPHHYRHLSDDELGVLRLGYQKAIEALRKNITHKGFSACSLTDNDIHGTDVNYRSVWARDGAMTTIHTLYLDEPDIRECQRRTLRTLLDHQSKTGAIPANVRIDTDKAEYSGVGGIAAIDSALWLIIACYRHAQVTGDWSIIEEYKDRLQKTMDWLGSHDSNNCGLLEIPEASDWADLFGYNFHVLYDEVLWHRCLICYSLILDHFRNDGEMMMYRSWGQQVRNLILTQFWPTTAHELGGDRRSFTQTQYSLGDSRYLVAQTSPFSFSWRCDVYGNVLAYLTNLIDRQRAMMTFRFMWGVGVNEPGPVKNLYPAVEAGAPEWRKYYTVNLLNLAGHYHNGGIWPFIGGMWVRYIHKLGMSDFARREFLRLAHLCAQGMTHEWEFNEWHHAETGRPMGKVFQAWSAASFIRAAHDLHVDPESLDHVV